MAQPPTSGGSSDSLGDPARFGVLTVSDRASSGVYEDLSGPAILQFFKEAVKSPWEAVYRVIPDEQPLIETAIIDMVSFHNAVRKVQRGGAVLRGTMGATAATTAVHAQLHD